MIQLTKIPKEGPFHRQTTVEINGWTLVRLESTGINDFFTFLLDAPEVEFSLPQEDQVKVLDKRDSLEILFGYNQEDDLLFVIESQARPIGSPPVPPTLAMMAGAKNNFNAPDLIFSIAQDDVRSPGQDHTLKLKHMLKDFQ